VFAVWVGFYDAAVRVNALSWPWLLLWIHHSCIRTYKTYFIFDEKCEYFNVFYFRFSRTERI